VKLIFLIILFARQTTEEEDDHNRRRDHREEREQFNIEQIAENQQRDNDILSVEQLESRERRHRRRRIMRHLRSRGVQEGTLQAIRHILEAALERDDEDSPEERVKIYSRIERVLYENDKHGNTENCPICCEDFSEQSHIKILPDCSHIFHEDCIEQWILKARTNSISCPVCRVEITASQDDTQPEEADLEANADLEEDEMAMINSDAHSEIEFT
jgi:hypothetical protein